MTDVHAKIFSKTAGSPAIPTLLHSLRVSPSSRFDHRYQVGVDLESFDLPPAEYFIDDCKMSHDFLHLRGGFSYPEQ